MNQYPALDKISLIFHNKRPLLFICCSVGMSLVAEKSMGTLGTFASESLPYASGLDLGDKYIKGPP
jgi:hypothetical protein